MEQPMGLFETAKLYPNLSIMYKGTFYGWVETCKHFGFACSGSLFFQADYCSFSTSIYHSEKVNKQDIYTKKYGRD